MFPETKFHFQLGHEPVSVGAGWKVDPWHAGTPKIVTGSGMSQSPCSYEILPTAPACGFGTCSRAKYGYVWSGVTE
jgi:hypothetical protein